MAKIKSKDLIVDAIEKIANNKGVKVTKIEPPKPTKSKKHSEITASFYKPTLYLDNNELPTGKNYKAGEKVVLTIEGTVRSISKNDFIADGESKERVSIDIEIDAIADITGV